MGVIEDRVQWGKEEGLRDSWEGAQGCVVVGSLIVGYKPHIRELKGILSHERGKSEVSRVLLTQEEGSVVCGRGR